MIRFTQGNLLDAEVDAVVNTVNTVGVMGKGIALMFKERFPENFKDYAAACKRGAVQVGRMFVTRSSELGGPRWIINFPTKQHWRGSSKLEWISEGLIDLKRVLAENSIQSVAIPPLGSGNGGLDWNDVRPLIETAFANLSNVEVQVFEPTAKYQNVTKGRGVEQLTPARALIAEMIRRYGMLGLDCSILEVQKLAWMLTREIQKSKLEDPLQLSFQANRYGPYAAKLPHLLNALDGSYLHCEKRVVDASPFDPIRFDPEWGARLAAYFVRSEVTVYQDIVEATESLIDGFQSPLGMEALATVDWLLATGKSAPTLSGIRQALDEWPDGAGERKQKIFSDQLLQAVLHRLTFDET
ncbi:MAG: macro domain-containing protein [Planctomycetaceae bacterium]|nr:macro domain-containing protein [Planctomycetaceae bacterium]